jgi:sulfonate transport system substrate-binding protein
MPVWNLVKLGPKHGFNVEMKTITTYADQERAAASGDADVATTGINMPAIIINNGTDNLRMIAGQQWAGQNLVVAKDVAINDWKDLEGKKIGVAPGTWARVLFLIAAQQHGVDLDKVDLTNIEAAGATALQALQRKDLDGIVLFSPSIDTAVVDGYAVYPENIDIGDVEFGDANGGLLANTDFLANKDLATKFMQAYVESIEQMSSDEDAFVSLGKEVAGVTDAVAREAFRHIRFSYNIDRNAALAAAKLGPQFGYAKQDFSDQVDKMLDFDLLTQVTGKSVDELSKPAPK